MIDPIIQANTAKQAVLEAAKAAFFLSGGKVEDVPIGASAGYKIPSPDHAGRAKGREKVLSAQRRKGLESAEKLRVCAAKGLTRDECAKELGWTPDRVRSTARIHGIELRKIKPGGGVVSGGDVRKALAAQAAAKTKRRADIAALITPLAAKGAPIADMAVAAHCSRATVMRVIEQFGIVRGKKMDIAQEAG